MAVFGIQRPQGPRVHAQPSHGVLYQNKEPERHPSQSQDTSIQLQTEQKAGQVRLQEVWQESGLLCLPTLSEQHHSHLQLHWGHL